MNSTAVDLAPLVQPLVNVLGLVILGLAGVLATKAVSVLNARFHLQLSAQQAQTIHDAADTAAGVLTHAIYSGAMSVQDVHISNPVVYDMAQTAMKAVPQAIAATGVSQADLAHIIVGRVGAMISADPTMDPAVTSASPLLPSKP